MSLSGSAGMDQLPELISWDRYGGSMPTWSFQAETENILWTTLLDFWDVFAYLNTTGLDIHAESTWANGEDYDPVIEINLYLPLSTDLTYDSTLWSTTCAMPGIMFSSWRSLRQCLSLAALVLARQEFEGLHSSVTQDIDEALSTFPGMYYAASLGSNETIPTQTNFSSYNGYTNPPFDGMQVLNATYDCLQDSFNFGTSDPSKDVFLDFSDGDWNVTAREIIVGLCRNTPVETSADVLGPGVSLSYVFHAGLMFIFWMSVRLTTLRRAINYLATPILRFRGDFNTFTSRYPAVESLFERIEQGNWRHVTYSMIPEFQESQCFFMICIEIALIFASAQSAAVNSVGNWESLITCRRLIVAMLRRGAVQLVLVQMTLTSLGLDFWYFMIFSTAGVIMAYIGADKTMRVSPDGVYDMFRAQGPPTEEDVPCGGNPSLATFCLSSDSQYEHGETDINELDHIVFVLLGMLWAKKLWSTFRLSQRVKDRVSLLDKRYRTTLFQARRIVQQLESGVWGVAEIFLVVRAGYLLAQHTKLGPDNQIWNIGQVISMLIWMPVISKYLYLLILGLEKGFKLRLSLDFEVCRRVIKPASDVSVDDTREKRLGEQSDGMDSAMTLNGLWNSSTIYKQGIK